MKIRFALAALLIVAVAQASPNNCRRCTQGRPCSPDITVLSATPESPSRISITFKTNVLDAKSFNIERATKGGTFVPIVSALYSGATYYEDVFLAPSTAYSYRMSVVRPSGASSYSNVACATTPAAVPTTAPREIYNGVDQARLDQLLRDMSGYNPVTVNGETFTISDRYLLASKALYRKYWTAYFQALGMPVTTIASAGSTNLEAVLPGKSRDSVIVIVHYDSTGPLGAEWTNPGVDDDMTGMAIAMETARLLTQYQGRLGLTVRFAAVDLEELGGFEGSQTYAQYIKTLATQDGFKIVAAVDDEQTGWNCFLDGLCGDATQGDVFDIWSCMPPTFYGFNFASLANGLIATASEFSSLKPVVACGGGSDHFAMWLVGIPALAITEHNVYRNGHFDHAGGDTYDRIHQGYYYAIAKVATAFAAKLAEVN